MTRFAHLPVHLPISARTRRTRLPDVRLLVGFTLCFLLALALPFTSTTRSIAADSAEEVADKTDETIDPEIVEILEIGCFACHADGEAEGGFDIEVLLTEPLEAASVTPATQETWHRVLKNVRSQIMPPSDAEPLTSDELKTLTRYIGRHALGVDTDNPDPGHVTLRRLNRIEYRNTVRDLTGVEFEAEVEFPTDDSGHGFDNLGEVLSLSPLLMEKYLAAAESIIADAVPMQAWIPQSRSIRSRDMTREFLDKKWIDPKEAENDGDGDDGESEDEAERPFEGRLSFYRKQIVAAEFDVSTPGQYRIEPVMEIDRGFEFDPGRARILVRLNDEVLHDQQYQWGSKLRGRDEPIGFDLSADLPAETCRVTIEIVPLLEQSEQERNLDFRLEAVNIVGPLEKSKWVRPDNWERFFASDLPAEAAAADRARNVISRFADRAFRRQADPELADRLVNLIANDLADPRISFERAVAKAFVVILSSPRFVFRHEQPAQTSAGAKSVPIDEYSLASRLSYFLWSTMPDAELMDLASRGQLRNQLSNQVDRMLADPRSEQFVSNFVGQWLKTRDIESIPIDVLGAAGLRPEYDALRDRVREIFAERREIARDPDEDPEVAERKSRDYREYEVRLLLGRLREMRATRDMLDGPTRRDLRRQTESLFRYVLDEDRNVLELLDNNYDFLNERLAEYYELDWDELNPNQKKDSDHDRPDRRRRSSEPLRRVSLNSSRRGGVLRQANFLIVTSNPTRTSPVKRGLFILDNILGTPAPPAPAGVPELEESAEEIADHEPTLRELLQRHRSDPLCASCHRRFDPIGLSLENYDAMGRWRDEQSDQPIDPSGELISGEAFDDASDLMEVLTGPRRYDFYRCLTEKLMTYALGRGIDYHDEPTIDALVQSLESEGQTPTLRRLIHAIVETPAMQKMRNPE